MELTIAKDADFIPEFNGNKALPEGEQVVVRIKVPTPREQSMVYEHSTQGANFNFPMAVTRYVTRVSNLKINGRSVETGRDIVDQPGLTSLVEEIGLHIATLMRFSDEEENPT